MNPTDTNPIPATATPLVIKKHVDYLPVVSLIFGIILVTTIILITVYVTKNTTQSSFFGQKETISPNVLWLTAPIMTTSGKIESISGNVIWIKQTFQQQLPIAIPANLSSGNTPKSISVPVTKTISYKVVLNDKTRIFGAQMYAPFVFKSSTALRKGILKSSDLDVGQTIIVTSSVDLRTVTNDTIDASDVQISYVSNTISGIITHISGSRIYVKALTPTHSSLGTNQPLEKEYTVTVLSDTEISVPSNSSQRLKVGDLTVGSHVSVYTDVDTSVNFNITAFLIQLPPNFTPVVLPTTIPTPVAPTPQTTTSPISTVVPTVQPTAKP